MTKHGDVLLRCTGSDGFVHASINFANLAFSSGYFRGMHEVCDDDSEMDVPALPYNESRLNGCSMKSASDAKRAQLLFVAHKFETGYDNPDLTLLYLFRRLQGTSATQVALRHCGKRVGKTRPHTCDFACKDGTVLEALAMYFGGVVYRHGTVKTGHGANGRLRKRGAWKTGHG